MHNKTLTNNYKEKCFEYMREIMSPQVFTTWIKPLNISVDTPENFTIFDIKSDAKNDEVNDNNNNINNINNIAKNIKVFLRVPNSFFIKWIKERYLAMIEEFSESYFGFIVEIILEIEQDKQNKVKNNLLFDNFTLELPKNNDSNNNSNKKKNNSELELTKNITKNTTNNLTNNLTNNKNNKKNTNNFVDNYEERLRQSHLQKGLTFENLIAGKANDLARAAAIRVSENPGTDYNPLFIYGDSGLGKTHLIHAIGNKILTDLPKKNVRYIHTEDYYNAVIQAYRNKTFDKLKQSFRLIDVLLIDDVQFLTGKARSQEEFFFLFNALVEAKKQIILTCDTYPKDIDGIDNRLMTRFSWGLTVHLEMPELEMRVAILHKKAELAKILLPDDVAFYIAKNFKSNVRDLEGALKKVNAVAIFNSQPINLELCKEALKDVIVKTQQIDIENILRIVADYYKVSADEILSKQRTKKVIKPRQVAMWFSRELTSHSLIEIGLFFNGRDHTTVLHAIRNINEMIFLDSDLKKDISKIREIINGEK